MVDTRSGENGRNVPSLAVMGNKLGPGRVQILLQQMVGKLVKNKSLEKSQMNNPAVPSAPATEVSTLHSSTFMSDLNVSS